MSFMTMISRLMKMTVRIRIDKIISLMIFWHITWMRIIKKWITLKLLAHPGKWTQKILQWKKVILKRYLILNLIIISSIIIQEIKLESLFLFVKILVICLFYKMTVYKKIKNRIFHTFKWNRSRSIIATRYFKSICSSFFHLNNS